MFVILEYLGSHVFVKCCVTSVGDSAAVHNFDCKKSADLLDSLTVSRYCLIFLKYIYF